MEKRQPNPLCTLRATDELRRQLGIVVHGAPGFAFLPIESLDAETLENLRKTGLTLRAVITGARAKSLGLGAGNCAVTFDAATLSLEQLENLADPLAAKAPLPAMDATPTPKPWLHALTLTKFAALLPAIVVAEGGDKHPFFAKWMATNAENLQRYIEKPDTQLEETARAKLPIEGAEKSTLVSFRVKHSASVHLALVVGELKDNPLVRIHSSCVTGDILGSLRCDCGPQLQEALSQIIASGNGVLVYLHQEGRGIGITNKLRAYKLQEQGVDTYDANLMLGFDEDERDFSIADEILKKLGVSKIRLLTNNPHKIESVEKRGITVTERVPLIAGQGAHNHAYIDAKIKKSGHLF